MYKKGAIPTSSPKGRVGDEAILGVRAHPTHTPTHTSTHRARVQLLQDTHHSLARYWLPSTGRLAHKPLPGSISRALPRQAATQLRHSWPSVIRPRASLKPHPPVQARGRHLPPLSVDRRPGCHPLPVRLYFSSAGTLLGHARQPPIFKTPDKPQTCPGAPHHSLLWGPLTPVLKGCCWMIRCGILGLRRRWIQSGARDEAGSLRAFVW